MTSRGAHAPRAWFLLALAAALWTAWRAVKELWPIATGPRLPFWDMAKYAVDALRLGDALARWDVLEALATIHGMSVWPPVWPVASALGFAIVGPEPWVPRAMVTGVWGAAVVASVWAPRPLPHGTAVGLFAGAWLAAGPLFQGLATVNLLEMPGLLLLILCLGAYLRALEDADGESDRWWWACAAFTVTLVFCKYNYGLLWIVPLAVSEARRRAGSWRELAEKSRQTIRRLPWGRPLWLLLVGSGVFLAGIRLTGGFELSFGENEVSVTSIGNPAYVLYLAVCLWAVFRHRRSSLSLRDRLLSLRKEDRIFLLVCGLPVALWMLLPPHVKELFGFLENRDSGLSWTDELLFYPRAIVELYAPRPWLGVLVLAAAVIGLRDLRGASHGRRAVVLCLWVSAAALLAHPYKLDRFAVQAAWLLGLAAAVSLVRPGPSRALGAAASALGLVALLGVGWAGPDVAEAEARHRLWTVDEEVAPLVLDLVDPARRRDGGVLVIGTWNGLSPALLEQTARLQDRQKAPTAKGEPAPLPATDFSVARRRTGRLVRTVEQREHRWVALVSTESQAGSLEAVFLEETAWTVPARELVKGGSVYAPAEQPRDAGPYTWHWFRAD